MQMKVNFQEYYGICFSFGTTRFWFIIHFYKDIKPVQTEEIEEILADDGEDISILGDNTKFIARINPNSTVVEGEEIELKIDPSKLHFFNPDTGDAI